jgi:hypothetical protein
VRAQGLFGNAVRAAQPATASPRLPRPGGFDDRAFFGLERQEEEKLQEGPLLEAVAQAARRGAEAANRLRDSAERGNAALDTATGGLERELEEASLLATVGQGWLN